MNLDVVQFSKHRLGVEPLPDDLRVLVQHAQEFAALTGIELNDAEDWAPWLDTSYLSEAERNDPDIAANVRAIAEVSSMVAFVAALEDGGYLGYWRGPSKRPVAVSPLICLDNEGEFQVCVGATFAEAVLCRTYGDQFSELRAWFSDVGVDASVDASAHPSRQTEEPSPSNLHDELYKRFLAEAR